MRFVFIFTLFFQLTLVDASAQHGWEETEAPSYFSFDFERWPYPLNDELGERMLELERDYPNLAKRHSIGKTRKGKDMWVMEITNFETGPGESKPGFWMDGNIHGTEITGRQYNLYFIERILASYGKDSFTTEQVDNRTFYVMCAFDADAGDRMLSAHPKWRGHNPEEHLGKDLNGDGWISQMRWRENSGDNDYRIVTEGIDLEAPNFIPGARQREGGRRSKDPITGEREQPDFNRNWSGLWTPEQSGAGLFPFSLPEVRNVAYFIMNNRNIYMQYSIHSGGGYSEGRSYLVRPIMDYPYTDMHHEDNDFYVRIGAVYATLSGGNITENNMYSWMYSASRPDETGKPRGYVKTATGYATDWAYLQGGIHHLSPEVSGIGLDYDNDGYMIRSEQERWHQEEEGGRWNLPWEAYDHPVLGEIEIGGRLRIPPAYGERLRLDCEDQYDYVLYLANLAAHVVVKDVSTEQLSSDRYKVTATMSNTGWLSTYTTRKAIEIRRDYPAVAEITLDGGELVDEKPVKRVGHLYGKFYFISDFDRGRDEMPKTVEWIVRSTGPGPLTATVEVRAPRGGVDQKTITVNQVNR